MGWIAQAIITAAAAFVATNIDDILILMLFFAQANTTFRPHHIVIGQYLGFVALILASLPGFFGGMLISQEWIGLLGILPIIIGTKQLLSSEDDEADVQGVACELEPALIKRSFLGRLVNLIDPQTYGVAAVTVANGGDNIGIYVPLFASSNLVTLGITLSVFFALIAVWCGIAYRLARFPAIAHVLTRYSHWLVPFILIGLGLYILIENQTYRLFGFA
ncbi:MULTISPECIES: cadmium resistance transporter [unclassified Leptolyngbya]|uniref:cadmium resistance transporter n=1 Tax=unclassified Leptolyngbya TaxID=2650499 RepID=UPI001688096D|nr:MULTISPECIES: cadmium resistance transporter [unclassified Leptolyngbya]MBD1909892.1 cadmium resistance transporter [Leptolyngbya sp. FACHB-8]MBD2158644.1 cadmium resistance transporter [Leptolyngbya sp. FACHB-16]